MLSKPIIFSSDIDGIMNDYPFCFLRYLDEHHGLSFASKDDAKSQLSDDYKKLKDEYRNSSYKFELPFCEDAVTFFKELASDGITIVFSTSRKFEDYPRMYDSTKKWLQTSGVEFQHLIRKTPESFIEHGITHHVDDEHEHAMKLSNILPTENIFLLARPGNTFAPSVQKGVNHVQSFDEIKSCLFDIESIQNAPH